MLKEWSHLKKKEDIFIYVVSPPQRSCFVLPARIISPHFRTTRHTLSAAGLANNLQSPIYNNQRKIKWHKENCEEGKDGKPRNREIRQREWEFGHTKVKQRSDQRRSGMKSRKEGKRTKKKNKILETKVENVLHYIHKNFTLTERKTEKKNLLNNIQFSSFAFLFGFRIKLRTGSV